MAFMAALESDLRALSAEARRRHPAVKDAAEHAILKLRSLSSPGDMSNNEDILRIFLMACDVRSVKLSVIGLSCLQKLISHDAVAPSALKDILATLKDHSEITDDTIQLKTLQTILIIFQSHLQPENEDNLAKALGICLRFLENNRSSDSVRNTAAATFRQAVALVFDKIVIAESLHSGKFGTGTRMFRSSSVTDDVSRNINNSSSPERDFLHEGAASLHKGHSKVGKLGLLLLEDLTALAAGGSATWLRVHTLQRIFPLDVLEFVLSNYAVIFRSLMSYEQVLRHQICSLLMTSLRTNSELEGETCEPSFRRSVLRSVAHVIRLYSKSLVTECEVFLNMLLKVIFLDLPLWHRILVLEILRGFCVEARTLRLLFQIFDMDPKNTNIVENIVKALARIVSTIQILDSSEESLAAVAGMFSSKAKGIEWSMDNDSSNAAVVVASEAHAITLAVEGLLGVVFTIATLTDEAVDLGEIESPKCDTDPPPKCSGETAVLCLSMVDTTWLTILDALSLILTRSQGEAIVLEILKAYQAFTQACGVLHAVEPLNSFLSSLCKFTISIPGEFEKKSVLLSPGTKKPEVYVDQRESIVLTPKNVQALRTLFNIAHRLHNVLGPSWVLVLETLAALDRAIHSPHASTQEVSTSVPKLTREMSALNSDFNILSSLNSQLFESSALMHISAVKSLLSALHQLSNQCNAGISSVQQASSILFSVERMTSILVNNLHRVVSIWNQIVDHLLELSDNLNPNLRNMALEALDKSICVVLGSNQFMEMENTNGQMRLFECDILSPLKVLYTSSQNLDVRIGTLKILLHVLERYGERLVYSWPEILGLLRSVADAPEKELVPLGFQSVRVIMNDGLSTIPPNCLNVCIDVTGAYCSQKTEINISLTAIGLLWTTTDFIAKGLLPTVSKETEQSIEHDMNDETGVSENKFDAQPPSLKADCCDKLLFSIFSTLQELGADGRPEVRNSAIRTLFQILGSHGHKLSRNMWEDCLWNYVFPILDRVHHLATTSSRDEWQGKELGTRGGKAIHMLIHHSRNTAQKQWDETIVLVLGGIARILRSFFPLLQSLSNFAKGWEELLFFVRDSMLNGSKEVALAAINCLQSVVSSHCPKGYLSKPYLVAILDVYELVFQNTSDYKSSAIKVKQEILHGLGDLYEQANNLFQNEMYIQLLVILHMAICQTKSTFDSAESEIGNTSPVQRTILEILPLLRPADHLALMWSHFFLGLLGYLPGSESLLTEEIDAIKQMINVNLSEDNMKSFSEKDVSENPIAVQVSAPLEEVASLLKRPAILYLDSQFTVPSDLNTCFGLSFGVKLVPVLVEIFLEAPANAKFNLSAVIIQSLGRCMLTRRDFPDGALWRVAVEGFNRVLSDFLANPPTDNLDPSTKNSVRSRLWKEVADVYEIFLLGSCGRALSSNTLSPEALKADESLEMSVLDVMGDKILKADIEAPVDALCRLVATLDRCAARTGSLPIETVGLMPLHCSRFSLCCLEKIFSVCRYSGEDSWHPSRSEVSKISVPVLVSRCEIILDQFITDESNLGEHPLPLVRIDEIIFVLQELSQLVLHSETASVLQLPLFLKESIPSNRHFSARAQLLCLFPSLCELVISREARVRELVQVLLRLVSAQLGLQRLGNTI